VALDPIVEKFLARSKANKPCSYLCTYSCKNCGYHWKLMFGKIREQGHLPGLQRCRKCTEQAHLVDVKLALM